MPGLAQEAGREASCSCLSVCQPSLTKCSSPAYPPSQHGPGSRVATMREGKQRDTEATWSQDGTWVGSSGYCWSLLKECIRSSPDLWRQLTLNTWAPAASDATNRQRRRRLGAVKGGLWVAEGTWTQDYISVEEGKRWLVPTQRACQRQLRSLCLADKLRACTLCPCFSTLHSGVRVSVLGQGKAHTSQEQMRHPGGPVVKNPSCKARDMHSILGQGTKIP